MNRYTALLTCCLLAWIPGQTLAAPVDIYYQLDWISGNRWQYSYTIANHSLIDSSGGVTWFSVYFPATIDSTGHLVSPYSNLAAVTPLPANWRSQVIQPGSPFQSPEGIYGASGDATLLPGPPVSRLRTPVLPGETLTGFLVAFDFAGSGTPPGPQMFRVGDLEADDPDFVLFQGTTQQLAVPQPPTIMLLASGLLGLAASRPVRR